MTGYVLRPATLSVLAELEEQRERAAQSEQTCENTFTEDDSVNGIECAAVRLGNHPPESGRSASSRMIR